MTFSFTFTPTFDDIARVRFAIGDTDPEAHRFEDELITALIAEYDGWQRAAIACIDAIINDVLSTPDFTADWLKMEGTKALPFYEKLRNRKVAEYGLTVTTDTVFLSGGAVSVTRSDINEQPGL